MPRSESDNSCFIAPGTRRTHFKRSSLTSLEKTCKCIRINLPSHKPSVVVNHNHLSSQPSRKSYSQRFDHTQRYFLKLHRKFCSFYLPLIIRSHSPSSSSFNVWSWLFSSREYRALIIGDVRYHRVSSTASVCSIASSTTTSSAASLNYTTQAPTAQKLRCNCNTYPCSRLLITSNITLWLL